MGPKKFKEMRNRISGLTLAQKQRLAVELQASVQHDELPEQVRRREAGNWTGCASASIAVRQGPRVTGSRQDCVAFAAARRLAKEPFTR